MENNKNNNSYLDSIHRLGRFGSIGALGFMLGIPIFISKVYNIWPDLSTVLKASIGLLTIFVPIAVSEALSYAPILGSSSYICYITGNVLNLKLPCAINSMKLMDVEQGSELGDVVSTIAIAASSITTMLIVALGVLLAAPLAPVFENPNINIATMYMLPALFGGMLIPMLFEKRVGEYEVQNRLLPTLIPFIGLLLVNTFIRPLAGLEGLALVVVIPTTILIARILYKKGIVRMEKIEDK